jgi:DNA-binding SARP family transcriptional activator
VIATIGLVLLLIGFPIGLANAVGWPAPTAMPSLDELARLPRAGVSDGTVVKAIAIVGWLAWAQLTIAAVVEWFALLRGRTANSFALLRGGQQVIARLVTSAAVLLGSAVSAAPAGAALADIREPITVVESTPSIASPDDQAEPTAEAVPDMVEPSYEVRRHDSWWGVAESQLGDGRRWRAIREANLDRRMPDGQIVDSTTEAVVPGWVLAIPADRSDSAAPRGDHSPALRTVVVRPGDNLWDIAEDQVALDIGHEPTDRQVVPYWHDLIGTNQANLIDPSDPGLIVPGQPLQLPSLPGEARSPQPGGSRTPLPPAPVSPQPAEEPPEPPSMRPMPDSDAAANPSDEEESKPTGAEADADSPADLLGVAGGLLAVGIGATVYRRRRRREQSVSEPPARSTPQEDLQSIKAAVALNADQPAVNALWGALRELTNALGTRRAPPRLRLIQQRDDVVELLLSEPTLPAPDGWTSDASGRVWVRDQTMDFDEQEGFTHPLLVTVGRSDDGSADYYLDLESEGLVCITGADQAAGDLIRSILLQLSTSPFAAGATVRVCGSIGDHLDGDLERIQIAGSWAEIEADVVAWSEQTSDLLAANRWSSAHAARAAGADDVAPVVVILDQEPDGESFEQVVRSLAERLIPLAVVVVGAEVDGATKVRVQEDTLAIDDIGLSCRPQLVDESVAGQIGALLEEAARPPAKPEKPRSIDVSSPAPRVNPDELSAVYEDPRHRTLVKVLGDIQVVGGRHPLSPKQTAVLTYLALNQPVSAERIEDAVWSAPTASRRKRLANTISEIRASLGADQLPVANGSRYELADGVATDLDLFNRRVAFSESQPDAVAADTLRGALELVEGPVFSYRTADRASYVWVDTEDWISLTELSVTDAAERLANLCSSMGDDAGAAWAARRGLRASPTHPRLTAALIRAHAAAGDRRAARQVYESHVAALEALEIDVLGEEVLDASGQIDELATSASGVADAS